MKDIIKNKKGFTLVELLAVIVVLAIIILVAMPNVMSAMEKARKNAFYSEATEICKIAQNAYNTDILDGKAAGGAEKCYDLETLVSEGHMDKNTKDYKGKVVITMTGDAATTKIWLSNHSYQYVGAECNHLSKDISSTANNPGNKMVQSKDDVTYDACATD